MKEWFIEGVKVMLSGPMFYLLAALIVWLVLR